MPVIPLVRGAVVPRAVALEVQAVATEASAAVAVVEAAAEGSAAYLVAELPFAICSAVFPIEFMAAAVQAAVVPVAAGAHPVDGPAVPLAEVMGMFIILASLMVLRAEAADTPRRSEATPRALQLPMAAQ